MIFQESDLQFNFNSAHWRVLKYDTHHYFKILSGAGLKGVDFIGIHRGKELVFFEVKHYRTNQTVAQISFLLIEDTDLFVEHIQEKMEDTLMAIKVVIKYLKRKAWYRYFLKLEKYIPVSLLQKKDWYFWHQIHRHWATSTTKSFVLWLEMAPIFLAKVPINFNEKLQKKLIKAFDHLDVRLIIANREKPIFNEDLNVKKEM